MSSLPPLLLEDKARARGVARARADHRNHDPGNFAVPTPFCRRAGVPAVANRGGRVCSPAIAGLFYMFPRPETRTEFV